MRRMIIWMMAVMLTGAISAMAQKPAIDELYLTVDEVPNAVYWLPVPPEPGSTQFVHDINQYYWGKEQRLDSARAQKAIREADHKVKDMVRHFSPVFGMEISEEKTPAIYNVVNRAVLTIRLSASKPKNTYMRKRPFVRFNEPTLVPQDEEELRNTGSYPSGHTVRGWGMALLLSEINPEAQDELFKLGYEWGQSRVIAGFHWQSDVDASRMLAAATYARLHACDAFNEDMEAAKKEFKKLKKQR
jgi:acid phosphatase (class A)